MAFMDNLKRAFENTARVAVKKSGEVFETAKNKYTEFDLNGELESLYAKLGKLIYTSYTSDDADVTEEVNALCDKIAAKREELENVKNR